MSVLFPASALLHYPGLKEDALIRLTFSPLGSIDQVIYGSSPAAVLISEVHPAAVESASLAPASSAEAVVSYYLTPFAAPTFAEAAALKTSFPLLALPLAS